MGVKAPFYAWDFGGDFRGDFGHSKKWSRICLKTFIHDTNII